MMIRIIIINEFLKIIPLVIKKKKITLKQYHMKIYKFNKILKMSIILNC